VALDKVEETEWEHLFFCGNGLPVPQGYAGAVFDPEELETALQSAMSHYDEMERPDTLPAEELPFQYVNWVIAQGYLAVNVTHECTYKPK
jgi:hypothetical protein